MASIGGAPQKTNGHTWHFAQGFHPRCDLDVVKKYLDPGSAEFFQKYLRNSRTNFDQLPFADTRITHVYDADPASAAMFAEAFPGVAVAPSLEAMVQQVDAVWMGDASGRGEDHFDLVAPGLAITLTGPKVEAVSKAGGRRCGRASNAGCATRRTSDHCHFVIKVADFSQPRAIRGLSFLVDISSKWGRIHRYSNPLVDQIGPLVPSMPSKTSGMRAAEAMAASTFR